MKTRNTIQKEKIQKEIDKFQTFFTAEELYQKVLKKEKNIGIATIYRYLKFLKEKKKIYTYTCNKKLIYSNEKRSHCHFECEESGKVIHFEIDSLDFLKNKIPGSITSFQIEIKGICNQCKTKNNLRQKL